MKLLDLTLATLADNVALDEALLLDAEAGGPEVLRFWECLSNPLDHHHSPAAGIAVIIGAGGKWTEEPNLAACWRDGVPILRRSSGGGAVLLGPGCLIFSLVLAYERHSMLTDLHGSYRLILDRIAAALAPGVPGIEPAGISDLAVGGRKCSGNAQQRKRTHLLHHGTLLCSFDLTMIPRYLAHPPREPDYRQRRSHLDFVTNVNLPVAEAKASLRQSWQADETMNGWPRDLVHSLCDEKYNHAAWHQRR